MHRNGCVTCVKEFKPDSGGRKSVRARSIAVRSPNWVVLLARVAQAMPTDVGHRVLRCGIMAWKQCVRCRCRVSRQDRACPRGPSADDELFSGRGTSMAAMKPRTGDGPLEVTKEGRGIVMRVPLEGGGRLVVELTPDEAAALADALKNVVV